MNLAPTIRHENGLIYIDNGPLVEAALGESYLTADIASGVGTFTVRNISGLAINQVLLIGELGEENAEIVKTHTATAPSGSTVTLAANTVRAHSTGDKVRILQYDQVNLSWSATEAGSKTNLTTSLGSGLVAIQADSKVQAYKETEQSSGYYFARYKDSIGAAFSSYTDPSPFGGWLSNSVGYAIQQALARLGLTLDGVKITRKYCYDDGINECLRLVKGKLRRWPKHHVFNYALGLVASGDNSYALPSDIYDATSNRSVIGVRIGTDARLFYEDPEAFQARFTGQDAGEPEGIPDVYTIRNGELAFAPFADSSYTGETIYLDYDTVPDQVNSDGDLIDFERYDMVVDYLTWKLKTKARKDGELDFKDGYYLSFKEKMNDAIRTSQPATRNPMGPRLNRVDWRKR